jgi:hypothetical protein
MAKKIELLKGRPLSCQKICYGKENILSREKFHSTAKTELGGCA